jgi:hypothetical protein
MARPPLLVCDTDALIQFLLIGEVRPLRLLRSKYSVQPVVVPEVEIELRSRKFGARIAPELTKAFSNGVLRMVDRATLESHYGGPPGGSMAATAALSQMTKNGGEYYRYVDRGEAHTYAAAMILGMPVLSNDKNALDVLSAAKLPVPVTVLRSFDLLALSYQVGVVSEADCDTFRSQLLHEKEHVPRCFAHKSFFNGLKEFSPRIRDSKAAPVGIQLTHALPYATVIEL